jgi:hypothetical protein
MNRLPPNFLPLLFKFHQLMRQRKWNQAAIVMDQIELAAGITR